MTTEALAKLLSTSLGPKGLDKLIQTPKNEVIISNDGRTILDLIQMRHPVARIMTQLSESQDSEAGDATTSVVVVACNLVNQCRELLRLGLKPQQISKSYGQGEKIAEEVIQKLQQPVDLNNKQKLIELTNTTISSKVIYGYADYLSPLIVDAVLNVSVNNDCNLDNIRIVKQLGGTLDDTKLISGLVFKKKISVVHKSENCKTLLLTFPLTVPKPQIDTNLVVADDQEINRLLEQERKITLKMCKKISKTGCNMVIIQKNALNGSISEMAAYFLKKLNINVLPDIDNEDIEYVQKCFGCKQCTHIEEVTPENIFVIPKVESQDGMTTLHQGQKQENAIALQTFVIRGANKLILDEADRSIHDGLCAVRCLVKNPNMVPAGSTVEGAICQKVQEIGMQTNDFALQAYGKAFGIITQILAENAGMNALKVLSEQLALISKGKYVGLDVMQKEIADMKERNIMQPALVSISLVRLATETARMILKIDDLVVGR